MDKRFIPVAMLAGALALAACGGGSNTTASGTGENGGGEEGDMMPAVETGNDRYKLVEVAGGYDLLEIDENDSGQIQSGGTIRIPGTNLNVTCEADQDSGCLWRINDGQVEVTGDYEAKRIDPPAAPKVGGATATSGETNLNWLSQEALVNAIRPDGSVELQRTAAGRTVRHAVTRSETNAWTAPARDVSAAAANTFDRRVTVDETEDPNADALEGLDTNIRLVHTRGRASTPLIDDADRDDDYLVYGTWETTARSSLNPDGYPKADVMWAGSIPYTTRLRFSTGTARYTGTALGHFRNNNAGNSSGAWREWEGNVLLDADFSTDRIRGTVWTGIPNDGSEGGTLTGYPTLGQINLGITDIGEEVDGTAKIGGSTDAEGSWQANFYGTRAIQGQPSGVAGGFKSERPFVTIVLDDDDSYISGQSGATVQGAFGAHNTGCVPGGSCEE